MRSFKEGFMKEIKAIIQPFKAEEVIATLRTIQNMSGMTVSEVHGYGKAVPGSSSREDEARIFGSKKIKLEMVVPDLLVEKVTEIITTIAHTGNPGDGRLFIYTVDDVIKIRTGERGEQAI